MLSFYKKLKNYGKVMKIYLDFALCVNKNMSNTCIKNSINNFTEERRTKMNYNQTIRKRKYGLKL